jgi:hypothetical protein
MITKQQAVEIVSSLHAEHVSAAGPTLFLRALNLAAAMALEAAEVKYNIVMDEYPESDDRYQIAADVIGRVKE